MFWRTDPAAPSPGSSISTGTHPNKSSPTKFCCRCWATNLAACWRIRRSRSFIRKVSFRSAFTTFRLPLAPRTWTMVLEPAAAKLRDKLEPADERVAELESIVTALSHLPDPTETDEAKIRERQREKEIVKRRLSELVEGQSGGCGMPSRQRSPRSTASGETREVSTVWNACSKLSPTA